MAVSDDDITFVKDLFSGMPDLSIRKMFGGLGVYSEGSIFVIMALGDRLFLKAKGDLAAALQAEGSEKFIYEGKGGKASSMHYWTLPDAALDDPELACDWAHRALGAANG